MAPPKFITPLPLHQPLQGQLILAASFYLPSDPENTIALILTSIIRPKALFACQLFRKLTKMSLANKLSIEDVDLKGKRVLIRVCICVKVHSGSILQN